MSKLTDQAHAYAAIDNYTHDKSFFVAYEGFKAGAEWWSGEMAKRKTNETDNTVKQLNPRLDSSLAESIKALQNFQRSYFGLSTGGLTAGRYRQDDPVEKQIRKNTEALRVKFRCFLSRIALANMSGMPIEDLESEFDKWFNKEEV